jgi:hypothetical protein
LPKQGGRWSGVTEATLTINKVTPGDAGAYDVVVSSGADSVTSPAANLTIEAPAGPFSVKLWRREGHKMHLTLSGHSSRHYVIEVSSDFKSWVPVATDQADAAGTLEYEDADSDSGAQSGTPSNGLRYYRARDLKVGQSHGKP